MRRSSGQAAPSPPRLARWLLAQMVPPGVSRDGLLGDLDELYADRREVDHPVVANLWYVREVTSAGVRYTFDRVVHRDRRERRRMGMRTWLSGRIRDMRYAWRTLRRQPAFAVVTILTLALGIGANTAVFSVLDGVLLRPLPYPSPDRLVRLYHESADEPDARQYLTGPQVFALRDEVAGLASIGALYTYRSTGADLTGDGPPRRLRVLRVSAGYFETYDATPLVGRTFTREEERPGAGVIVLSHRLWLSETGGDRSIIGRTLDLDGAAMTVIGVMRPGFRDLVGGDVDVWRTLDLQPGPSNGVNNHYLTAVARLAHGVTATQVRDQIEAMENAHRESRSDDIDEDARIVVYSLASEIAGETGRTLVILMGAAGLVLLIACVNVANLFLARNATQRRELAVRSALGAGRGRLLGQQLAESLVVAAAGGLAGCAIAAVGVRALLLLAPGALARAEDVGFDPRLLLFAVVVTALTGVLFGVIPALQASSVDPNESLRDGTRGNTSRHGGRIRSALVTTQVALALVLLVGAGVLLRSFSALLNVELGFDPEHVTTFEVNLPSARYETAESRVRFHDQFLERLRALPAVEAAGATSWLPANGEYHNWFFESSSRDGQRTGTLAQVRVVEGDFFRALGIDGIEGRTFNSADHLDSPLNAIVSRRLLEEAFGERAGDAIGTVAWLNGDPLTVVGVVPDVAYDARGAVGPVLYLSHSQYANDRNWTMTYTVRTAPGSPSVVDGVRRTLAALDPGLVLYQQHSLASVLGDQRARDRFSFLLMTIFATVALSLAAIGVYGVLSYAVSQRAEEMGIRLAVGARPAQVRAGVLLHGLQVAAAGLAIGIPTALGLGRLLRSMVFDVSPSDPAVFIAVATLLVLATLTAAWIPASRATRADPLRILRRDA
jgi:putative ABC transport system permease protein